MSSCSYHFLVLQTVALLLGISIPSIAQQTASMTGRVSDQSGASVVGANVELVSGSNVARSATTDSQGRYQFEGLKPGEYTIRVTAAGFQSMERRVTAVLSEPVVADFGLGLQRVEQQVVVTAGALSVPGTALATVEIQRTPGGVQVVPDTAFRNSFAQTVKDVVQWVPGVVVQTRYGPDARVSIRGSGLSRSYGNRSLNLYMDGIPFHHSNGLIDLVEMDPTAFRYVEVYKGANALRYGANALGGAINFVAPAGRDAPPFEARLDTGSFGYLRFQASTGGAYGRYDYFITGSAERQDEFRDHSNGHTERLKGNFGIRLKPDVETRFYVNATVWRSRIPGELDKTTALTSPRSANPGWVEQDQQRNMNALRFANKTTLNFGRTTVDLGIFGAHIHVMHPIFQWLDFTVRDYGGFGRATDDRRLGGFRNRLVTGVNVHNGDINNEQFVNLPGAVKGALVASNIDKSDNVSSYVEDSFFFLSNVALVAGAQFQHSVRERRDRFLSNGDQSGRNSFDIWSPKGGVLWDVTRSWQVFANVSRSAEVPTFDVNTFATPANSTVDAQTATTYEIGTRGQRPEIAWDFSFYRADIRNELQCLTSPLTPGACTVRNADRTVHQGVEAGISMAILKSLLAKRVWFNGAYTYNDFFFDRDPLYASNRLPGVPPHTIRAEMIYKHPSGISAGPNIEWMPRAFFADNANSLTVDPYALLNFKAGFDEEKKWSGYIEARNLLDRRYISTAVVVETASPTSALFNPGYGRALRGGIRFKW